MDDQKQLFLFAFPIPLNEDRLIDRIKEASSARNQHGAVTTVALASVDANSIVQCGRVARLKYTLTTAPKEDGSGGSDDKSCGGPGGNAGGGSGGPGGTAATAAAAAGASGGGSGGSGNQPGGVLSRGAKIRRVMMTARRTGERAGVIVDRSRPLVPASAIPEDLIAQAQVVLQGKSRDVIVRELQRTNLNVNEAVNNLLSRDDEEG
ncbi:unnamed protein product, partial [Gongylonema pulchrum]|uniref:UBA domain-containing protein n=1 Tax=Gongylonema pulchrum TaxID=637853 RepID=A0A183EG97_9BILA